MTTNPWSPRPPAKKRIITASVTAEQDAAFEEMKARLNLDTDGALIKLALERLWESTTTEGNDHV